MTTFCFSLNKKILVLIKKRSDQVTVSYKIAHKSPVAVNSVLSINTPSGDLSSINLIGQKSKPGFSIPFKLEFIAAIISMVRLLLKICNKNNFS